MSSKVDLETALRSSANDAAAVPERSFVDGLEQRLLSEHGRVVPFAHRVRRISVAAAAAITFTIAGVAAATGIVVTHPFKDEPTAPAATTVPTASTEVAVATTAVTGSVLSPPGTATSGGVPVAPTTPVTLRVVAPVATEPPATQPPATVPPATVPATISTSTTEVHRLATLAINCAATGTGVACNWSGAVPDGAATYAVLRGETGSATPGRVFYVPLGTTSWVDPIPTAGVSYSYLVHIFDANNQSLAHSNAAFITCC